DGDAERLRLEVEERVLDSRDRLRDHRPGALPRAPVELPVDALDGTRVATDDERGEVLDDRGEPARGAVGGRDLRPAAGPVVRGRLPAGPPPAGRVAGGRLEGPHLHRTASPATSPRSNTIRLRCRNFGSGTSAIASRSSSRSGLSVNPRSPKSEIQ